MFFGFWERGQGLRAPVSAASVRANGVAGRFSDSRLGLAEGSQGGAVGLFLDTLIKLLLGRPKAAPSLGRWWVGGASSMLRVVVRCSEAVGLWRVDLALS